MQQSPSQSRHTLLFLILIAWLAMLGLDFFLHGGLLAGVYLEPSPFLLPPLTAFARIPFGYAGFLLQAALLVWLMARLGLAGWRSGAVFGLQLGALTGGGLVLGLVSISTASYSLLFGWFVSQTLEMAVAGAFAGSGLAGARLRRLFGLAAGLTALLAFVTILLQSLGVVPALRLEP